MIPIDLDRVAEMTGGSVHGDGSLVVSSVAIDSRAVEAGTLFAALAGEHVDGHEFASAAIEGGAPAVLASRVLDVPCVVVPDVTAALATLARNNRSRTSASVIGLTGSQGKTSVKDLLAHILDASGPTIAPPGSLNNELGVPLTVLRADADTTFLVIEMGARGVGHIAELCAIATPDIGMVLNVGSAHVGEFGSAEVIAQAKGELVEALSADGVAVLNADDPLVSAMASRTSARVLTFGTEADVALGPVSLDEDGQPHFTLTFEGTTVDAHVPQIGEHHAVNAAAAAAAAIAVGIDLGSIAERLSTATAASPMRMEHHVRGDGLVVINDAYNANPESMAAALRAVATLGKGRPIAVLGEMLELGEASRDAHLATGRLAADLGYVRVIAVGPGAAAIAEGAGEIGETTEDVDTAVEVLSASLRADDVVLVKASRGGRLERVALALLAH